MWPAPGPCSRSPAPPPHWPRRSGGYKGPKTRATASQGLLITQKGLRTFEPPRLVSLIFRGLSPPPPHFMRPQPISPGHTSCAAPTRPTQGPKSGCKGGYGRLQSGCGGRAGGCEMVGGRWGAGRRGWGGTGTGSRVFNTRGWGLIEPPKTFGGGGWEKGSIDRIIIQFSSVIMNSGAKIYLGFF